jgi:hypothetical protein
MGYTSTFFSIGATSIMFYYCETYINIVGIGNKINIAT